MKSSLIEVVTPALTHDLTTLDIAKEELGITDDATDARIARWITETSTAIARACNRTLAFEEVREVWHSTEHAHDNWQGFSIGFGYSHTGVYARSATADPKPLTLRRFPVETITSVTCDGEVVDLATYEADPYRGRLWRMSETYRDYWYGSVIEVVYSGGYHVPDGVPPDLQAACVSILQIRNDVFGRDRMMRSREVPGVYKEEWWNPTTSTPSGSTASGFPPDVAEMLRPFQEYNS